MGTLYFLLRRWRPYTVNRVFGKLQLLSSAYMGFSHGTNDAQKTMGIIALALMTATAAGYFHDLPHWLGFLVTPEPPPGKSVEIAVWIKVVCALTMAAGTAAGGWRIIKTLGHKMVKLHPVHGFAAETTGATVLLVASHLGMPVSTTHAITTSIMGVGCAKGFNALKLSVVNGFFGRGFSRFQPAAGWVTCSCKSGPGPAGCANPETSPVGQSRHS